MMTYFGDNEEAKRILNTDYTDRINHSPMTDGEEIRAFFDVIREEEKNGRSSN